MSPFETFRLADHTNHRSCWIVGAPFRVLRLYKTSSFPTQWCPLTTSLEVLHQYTLSITTNPASRCLLHSDTSSALQSQQPFYFLPHVCIGRSVPAQHRVYLNLSKSLSCAIHFCILLTFDNTCSKRLHRNLFLLTYSTTLLFLTSPWPPNFIVLYAQRAGSAVYLT